MRRRQPHPSLRIAGLYLLTGTAWIFVSDRLLGDHQTLKGLAFVLASSLLIGLLVHQAWQYHQRSERRFQAVIEHGGEIISIIDRDGNRKYHSPAITQMLGYQIEDLLDTGILHYVHPDDQPRARALLTDIAGQPYASTSIELRVFHGDGSLRHLHVTVTNLLDDPAVEGIILNTRDITQHKHHELQIRHQLDQLRALHAIDLAILASRDQDATLDVVLQQVIEQLAVDAASILLCDHERQQLSYAAGRGFRSPAIRRSRLTYGEGYAGKVLAERRPQFIHHLDEASQAFTRTEYIEEEDFVAYGALPLVADGKPIGVLDLFSRSPLNLEQDWLEFAEALAAQTAIAIDNARLYSDLHQAHASLELAYDRTLEGWAKALELRDDETEGHSRRVVTLTMRLADELGIATDQQIHIRRGALLHDIGKIGIPDSILLKPGPLTEEEWTIMRLHPHYAYELLKAIPYLHPALDIPHAHHERWDGTGYPRGLCADEIPIAARIFAAADVYDALTSERPYRPAWTSADALTYIAEQAGEQFDPAVCDALQRLFDREQTPLSNGRQHHLVVTPPQQLQR